jgi:hypothetical protein
MTRHCAWSLPVVLSALLLAGSGSAADDPEVVAAEKLLKGANVATDGDGLLAFFKARTLAETDQDALKKMIRNLGDDSFDIREQASKDLVKRGRLSLPYLKAVLDDSDAEVAKRARECVDEIESAPHQALMAAAVRLAVEKKPAGLAEALLGCLPWIDDDSGIEAAFDGLLKIGLNKDGVAAETMVKAAKDKQPMRRAAAAIVLGQAKGEQRRLAAKLMTDDDPRVRFHAAISLLRARESEAVGPLVALLSDAPPTLAWQVEDMLCRIAGEKSPTATLGPALVADRKKCRDAWEAWWKDNRAKVDLKKINFEDAVLGLTMVAELDGSKGDGNGRVWEVRRDGTAVRELTKANRPIDAQGLSNGHILVAEHGTMRVAEFDRDGKVVWEHKTTRSQPVSCQRLPNGNTFIATYNELLEVTRDNKVVYSHQPPGVSIWNGYKLRNGNILYVTANNFVIEMNPDGKEVAKVTVNGTGGWASADKLANGHFLVALYSMNKVVEVDAAGKVVWEVNARNPGHATRLANGNTLVASIEGREILEFDRDKKQVWSQKVPGRPFHVRRR